METFIIIGIIIFAVVWLLSFKANSLITSQDGFEDCVNNTRQPYKREVNDHLKHVMLHPATQKLNARRGAELHELALKNKRNKRTSGI